MLRPMVLEEVRAAVWFKLIRSLKKKVLLNNFFGQPFAGFDDLEMDQERNFYLTDSKAGWVCDKVLNCALAFLVLPQNSELY